MAPLSIASRALARGVSRQCNPRNVRAISTTTQLRDAPASSYSSPFKGTQKGNDIPNWGNYMSADSASTNKMFQYFMVGTLGAITAAGAKSTVQGT